MANLITPPHLATPASIGRELRNATADLYQVNPAVGLGRFFSLGAATLAGLAFAWSSESWWSFGLGCSFAGLTYSFWIICNHDAAHRTLTGWNWFDAIAPRLISWPILVPHGTYAAIHSLHHAWNAVDLRDPERIQRTLAEYEQASGLQRWAARHQWVLNALVLGITGLILKTVRSGLRNRDQCPQVQQQVLLDIAGMVVTQGGILLTLLLSHVSAHIWLRYAVMLLLLERIMSLVIQGRDYLEHYGRWQKQDSHLLTQLYGTRNIKTYGIVSWLMGGLPHHSIHHAFPGIAFNQLPLAQARVEAVLRDRHYPPIPQGSGYLKTSWQMMRQGLQLIPQESSQ